MADLSGKVALVTGASRGIGAAIAKRLAQDGAAAAITFSASPQKAGEVIESITRTGGRAIPIQADSGDAGAVKRAVHRTVEEFGQLDILVNHAGAIRLAPIGDFPETSLNGCSTSMSAASLPPQGRPCATCAKAAGSS